MHTHLIYIMKVSRNWLQTFFADELPSADELAELLTFHAFEIEGVEQVGDDWVIDVDVLPNRSSDCLSHRGIARELSTLLSVPLERDPLRDVIPAFDDTDQLGVDIADKALCPRYMGVMMRGVEVGPSPEWLKVRLEVIGQKSINNIVDATNYVMFELGQPLHAFDLAKLGQKSGVRSIFVRAAEDGEMITVLSGETRTLSSEDHVIADGVSGAPLALAGVKGGNEAEVTADTTDILLEAASFDYLMVRKMARRHKLSTDASLRFQNEPARQLPAFAMRDLVTLIKDVAGGQYVGGRDVYAGAAEHTPVDVTLGQINSVLGVSLSVDEVEQILVRFEWEFSRDGEEFAITSPWERTDLHEPVEFIEEIGRVWGYRNITSVLPKKPEYAPSVSKQQYYTDKIRRVLAEREYDEVLTYTLSDHGEVELANALASDKGFMRMDLREGLLEALELNTHTAPFLGLDTLKLFEIGTVFRAHGEVLHLALGSKAVSGKQSKADKGLMADLATLAEALGMEITEEAVQDGVVELSVDALLVDLPEPDGYVASSAWNPHVRYKPWSSYPCVYRDIAVWVPAETPSEEVLAVIIEVAPDTLVKHYQFDSFEKDGRVSYAWHLVFQSTERTLTNEEIEPVMTAVTEALNSREGWEVR